MRDLTDETRDERLEKACLISWSSLSKKCMYLCIGLLRINI